VADVIVFHHAQGLTPGVRDFADRIGAAGHEVAVPDLYDGRTFETLPEGVAHAEEIGFPVVIERGKQAAEELPRDAVYLGISLGVLPAQMLAQTRTGARGAVLVSGCVPVTEFGSAWPLAVPVQVHGMDSDEIFVTEGDLDAARTVVASGANADLFLYPGHAHLFADRSLGDYDSAAAQLLEERVLEFLDEIDRVRQPGA
jgi:dienelactone hydrolase